MGYDPVVIQSEITMKGPGASQRPGRKSCLSCRRREGIGSGTGSVDTTGAPTMLALGSLHWHVIARDGRLGVRLRDVESPARAGFDGIPAFDVDPAWRLAARFERYDPPRTLQIPTILGTVSAQPSPGALVFDVDGQTQRLDVVGEPGDSTFFVIFGDRTNGETTYEAGRYLYVDAPDTAGRVVVDFNKAYNPPCAFTPFATCPEVASRSSGTMAA